MKSFMHQVSKGTRFNQIYIPREYRGEFEVGDIVQVKLIHKKNRLHYSPKLHKLSDFKEKIIQDIFSEASKFKEIEQVFIFGSFLTKKVDYNDIDVILISDKEKIEDKFYEALTDKLNMKFHIVSFKGEGLEKQLKISPLLRSMFYYFISNKLFSVSKEKEIDVNHIKYLIWFPEDLLKVRLDRGKVYYDVLRKLIIIEHFLKGKDIAPESIDEKISKSIDKESLKLMKEDFRLSKPWIEKIELIIKGKLKIIKREIKNVEKR